MSHFPDLIVLIPGITGSILVSADGSEVWNPSINTLWRTVTDSLGVASKLKLMGNAKDDGITPLGLVPDITIIPGLVKIDGYARIAQFLVDELDLERDANFREFPYDWRRDNRESALRLKELTTTWLQVWRKKSGNDSAKLVLIGHSMGGLVARYFFECLEGWRDTRMIMTLGTPHSGSLNALNFLEHGLKKSIGPWGIDLSPALRSMPSVYQLLPTYRCIAVDNGPLRNVHEVAQIGLLSNVDENQVWQASLFHEEIRKAAEANKQLSGYPSPASALVPFVGIQQPTTQSAIFAGNLLKMVNALAGQDDGGDGTVPRLSAAPPGWDARLNVYAGESHGSLQNASCTLVNIKGFLTKPVLDMRQFLSAATPSFLSLELDDVVSAGNTLTLRARRSSGNAPVFVVLTSAGSSKKVEAKLERDGETGWQLGVFTLEPGIWRVTASSANAEPVHELVVVADA